MVCAFQIRLLFMNKIHRIFTWSACFCVFAGSVSAATLLPVGPIVFDAHADYDTNFRTNGLTGITRTSTGGYGLRAATTSGSVIGAAVFDESSTNVGTAGKGGTSGSQTNNDLSDFTISANVQFNARATSNVAGFFLRLDNNDSNGYLATVELIGSSNITFRLYEGVGITSAPTAGQEIFSQQITQGFAISTWHEFSVTAEGNAFSFSFQDSSNNLVTASYIDPTLTRTVGQTGVYLTAGSSGGTNMNQFEITAIPEPSALVLLTIPMAIFYLQGQRKRMRKA